MHVNKNESKHPTFTGLPLEMSQKGWIGSAKVALVFFSGVILGSMGSGVSEKTLIEGSSAGTYALISAHMGTYLILDVFLNTYSIEVEESFSRLSNLKIFWVST